MGVQRKPPPFARLAKVKQEKENNTQGDRECCGKAGGTCSFPNERKCRRLADFAKRTRVRTFIEEVAGRLTNLEIRIAVTRKGFVSPKKFISRFLVSDGCV